MIYFLIAAVVCGILTGWCFYATQHGSADDFGAALPFLFFAILTVLFTLIYVGLVFWHHRFF